MKLYEVTNGYEGESYVRVYVRTDGNEERAKELARVAFKGDSRHCASLAVELLFDEADPAEFTTLPSSSGWER